METAASVTRRELGARLIEKAWKDPEFKKAVVSDPKGLFENYLGKKLPEHLRIIIHEEDASTLHFSIPPAPRNLTELSDEDLEKVAGGTDVVISAAFTAATMLAAAVTAATAVGTVVGSIAGATIKSGW